MMWHDLRERYEGEWSQGRQHGWGEHTPTNPNPNPNQAAAEDYPYDRRPAWLAAPEEEQARVNEPEAQPKRAQLVPQREEDAYFVDKRMTSGGIADAEMDDATQVS